MTVYDIYEACNNWVVLAVIYLTALFILIKYVPYMWAKFNHREPNGKFFEMHDSVLSSYSYSARRFISATLHILLIIATVLGAQMYDVEYDDDAPLRTLPNGTYCLEVNATRNGKTYRLPAKVIKTAESYIYYKGDTEHTVYHSVYIIENVYFSNGGYLWFEFPDEISDNGTAIQNDQQDREWELKLTGYRSQHPSVTEKIDGNDESSKISSRMMLKSVALIVQIIYLAAIYVTWHRDIKKAEQDEEFAYSVGLKKY